MNILSVLWSRWLTREEMLNSRPLLYNSCQNRRKQSRGRVWRKGKEAQIWNFKSVPAPPAMRRNLISGGGTDRRVVDDDGLFLPSGLGRWDLRLSFRISTNYLHSCLEEAYRELENSSKLLYLKQTYSKQEIPPFPVISKWINMHNLVLSLTETLMKLSFCHHQPAEQTTGSFLIKAQS